MNMRFLMCLGLITMLMGGAPVTASAQEGLGERLGKELDEKLNELSRELKEGWSEVESFVDRLGVRGRVYSRIHWDKALASQPIGIEANDKGVVVLTGKVKDEASRQKAVQLAEDTLGVNEVVDRLKVVQPEEPQI